MDFTQTIPYIQIRRRTIPVHPSRYQFNGNVVREILNRVNVSASSNRIDIFSSRKSFSPLPIHCTVAD